MNKYNSIFKAIRIKDRMLHFPYQSYDSVLRFLTEAAIDPKVEEIKATQYRVANDSAIVAALISAARNGKKVTVFVEVQARFDEAANLFQAEKMKQAGVKVIYSIPGLKVHAKIALVIKKPNKEKIRTGYAFLSTGNFNEKTAKIYADHGFFTSDQEILDDLKNIFKYLEIQDKKSLYKFNKLLIAQFNLRRCLTSMINKEIKNAKQGKPAFITLKMNGLQEEKMIEKLYEASQSGVKINLIIRGICCLIPGKEFSKNITVTRIVDRFLEHARIYLFHNDGANDLYLSSADWMNRNLHRRIEAAFPISDEGLKNEIIDILELQLQDNVKACHIDSDMKNVRVNDSGQSPLRSQMAIYDYLCEKHKD